MFQRRTSDGEVRQRRNARHTESRFAPSTIRNRIAYFIEKRRQSNSDLACARESELKEGLRENDIVIALLGPTGSGRSTFIRTATGSETPEVSDTLGSCTIEIIPTIFRDLESGLNVVLLDTPGFNNIFQHGHNFDILNQISCWLKSRYKKRKFISGILYLHRITDNRTPGTLLQYLGMFQQLLGEGEGLHIITTMWDLVETSVGEQRLKELQENDWKAIIGQGARIACCRSDNNSPKKILRHIIDEPFIVVDKDELGMNDIVIAVMGPTGSGKSAFIRSASGSKTPKVSDALKSSSNEVLAVKFREQKSGRHVVLVDTPGFGGLNNKVRTGLDVFNMITAWLDSSYKKRKLLSGIFYLHQVTDNRTPGTLLQYLGMFRHLLGEGSSEGLRIITTMWDLVETNVGEQRLKELQENDWKAIIGQGARIARCRSDNDSPKKILQQIIDEPFVVVDKNELGMNDIVIAVMGPTGSGKSTFIRSASGSKTPKVSDALKSSINEVLAVKFKEQKSGRHVVLVDTPGLGGLNNKVRTELNVFNMISAWLDSSYHTKRLSGILYLHRIMDNRIATAPLGNRQALFRKLLGGDALDKLYLTTTMWDEVEDSVGDRRLEELKVDYWKEMIDQGAQIACCMNADNSPKEVLRRILDQFS